MAHDRQRDDQRLEVEDSEEVSSSAKLTMAWSPPFAKRRVGVADQADIVAPRPAIVSAATLSVVVPDSEGMTTIDLCRDARAGDYQLGRDRANTGKCDRRWRSWTAGCIRIAAPPVPRKNRFLAFELADDRGVDGLDLIDCTGLNTKKTRLV